MQNLKSNRYPIATFLLIAFFIGFLYFSFTGFFEGIMNRGETGAGSATGITYMYNRFCSLGFVIIGLFFYYRGNPITLSIGRTLFLLFVLEFIRACIDPSGDLWINRVLSPTTWILFYFGVSGFFMCYGSKIPIRKKVIALLVIYSILFLINYIATISLGITEWHYIESYYLLTLLPLIILLSKKARVISIIIVFAGLLLAGKRTGLVVFGASMVVFMIYSGHDFTGKVKSIFYFILISCICLLSASYIFPDKMAFAIERFSNIEKDGGSGRDVIYEVLLDKVMESEGIDFIFGHGYNAVVKDNLNRGLSAHNEFLEFGWDYGVLGLSLFSLFLLQLFRLSKCNSLPEDIRLGLLISAVILLFLSLLSHVVLYSTYVLNLVIFWGLVTAYITKQNKGDKKISFS